MLRPVSIDDYRAFGSQGGFRLAAIADAVVEFGFHFHRLQRTKQKLHDNIHKDAVVQKVVAELGIERGFGELLPEDKVEKVEALRREDPTRTVAFMGDGINDALVLASADVGIAMGALGSDAAIETADVVIQTDEPSKIATAIRISRATRRVVWQNIGLAFGVKVVVLALGAGGLATMWEWPCWLF